MTRPVSSYAKQHDEWLASTSKAIIDTFADFPVTHENTAINELLGIIVDDNLCVHPTNADVGEFRLFFWLDFRPNDKSKSVEASLEPFSKVNMEKANTLNYACRAIMMPPLVKYRYIPNDDMMTALCAIRDPFRFIMTHSTQEILADIILNHCDVKSRRKGVQLGDDPMGKEERNEIYASVLNDPFAFTNYEMRTSPVGGDHPLRPYSYFDTAVRLLAKELLK